MIIKAAKLAVYEAVNAMHIHAHMFVMNLLAKHDSMQREKPYPPLTWQELTRDGLVLEREPAHRCCMAVVSSCREMLG